ncbi:VOC family protein [Nocardia rhamnosiphila]|uniref:VOC family protein n=1 Tax=Nocardia rhamnosiphila TaxID=426716 RepID=A0ABV2WYQ2_9NOCA
MTALYGHSAVTVTDMRTSLRYYREGLGLEVVAETSGDGHLRVELELPGTDCVWALEEYRTSDRYLASSRPCDPGFAHLCLYVGDADGVFDRLQSLGFTSRAPVATVPSGAHKGARNVYTLDPDGFVVELYERPGAAGPSVVTGFFHHGLTVAEIEPTLAFWQQSLGAPVLRRSAAPGSMAGIITGLDYERMETAFVGLDDGVSIEIFEYQGIERHPALARAVDPGSSRLALRVPDPEELRATGWRPRREGDRPRVRPDRLPDPAASRVAVHRCRSAILSAHRG